MRRTWSVVDVLTALKRNTNHRPTAALIRRKVDALSLPALDKLGCLVDLTILQRHGHYLSTRHYHGFQLAINSFPDQTATEVALVHCMAVHGRAERVPVDAALVGSAEALRVRDAIDAASGGGGGGV